MRSLILMSFLRASIECLRSRMSLIWSGGRLIFLATAFFHALRSSETASGTTISVNWEEAWGMVFNRSTKGPVCSSERTG